MQWLWTRTYPDVAINMMYVLLYPCASSRFNFLLPRLVHRCVNRYFTRSYYFSMETLAKSRSTLLSEILYMDGKTNQVFWFI